MVVLQLLYCTLRSHVVTTVVSELHHGVEDPTLVFTFYYFLSLHVQGGPQKSFLSLV